jgi:hypothetical protein
MENKKKAVLMLTPLLAATVITGCGDAEQTKRDVYSSQEECIKDWGDAEMCTRPPKEDEDEYYRHNHGVYHPIFWGPTYYGSDRTVVYKGQTISPTTRNSSMAPYGITSRSSSSAGVSAGSPRGGSFSRGGTTGGFGGRSSGGGFGS